MGKKLWWSLRFKPMTLRSTSSCSSYYPSLWGCGHFLILPMLGSTVQVSVCSNDVCIQFWIALNKSDLEIFAAVSSKTVPEGTRTFPVRLGCSCITYMHNWDSLATIVCWSKLQLHYPGVRPRRKLVHSIEPLNISSAQACHKIHSIGLYTYSPAFISFIYALV